MPTSKKITDFVINKVPTKAIFNKMKEQGLINDDEIYLVEEDDSDNKYVSYESQSLTATQMEQARNNIRAIGKDDNLKFPNPNELTIKIGSTTITYDGSADKTVEIEDGTEVSY